MKEMSDSLIFDAEIISQFVHYQIRQLPGVSSTTTLIPGISKVKESDVSFKNETS